MSGKYSPDLPRTLNVYICKNCGRQDVTLLALPAPLKGYACTECMRTVRKIANKDGARTGAAAS